MNNEQRKTVNKITESEYVDLWESLENYEFEDYGDFCVHSGLSRTHGAIALISSINGNYARISNLFSESKLCKSPEEERLQPLH
jgi:hypothetical protein